MIKNVKVAIFVNSFPSVSETFIANQIAFAASSNEIDAIHLHVLNFNENLAIPAHLLNSKMAIVRFPGVGKAKGVKRFRRFSRQYFSHGGSLTMFLRGLFTSPGEIRNSRWFLEHLAFGKRDSYDVVHLQYAWMLENLERYRKYGLIQYDRLVVSCRGHDITQRLKDNPGRYVRHYKHVDKFLPVSKSLMQPLVATGCPVEKIEVLHSGIDVGAIEFRPRVVKKGEGLRFCSVGRLTQKKGHVFAIAVIRGLISRGFSASLRIIGEGEDRNLLLQEIQRLQLTDNVVLVGALGHEQTLEEIGNANMFILHSVTASSNDQEGIPNVLKEAMAIGRCVVSTWHSGIPELLDEGALGVLAQERDIDDTIQAIVRYVESCDQKMQLLEKARSKIEAEFDIRKLNKRLMEIYLDRTSVLIS